MRTTESIRLEIQKKLNFIPPFFGPAFDEPTILANLWDQTLYSYLDNPLPALFKEKIATLLATYCSAPYCLICHSSTLRPLGMEANEILAFLNTSKKPLKELEEISNSEYDKEPIAYPEANSREEQIIFACCALIYLNQNNDSALKKLRRILRPGSFKNLILFLAYNKTALSWTEAHPEISYLLDKRVQDNLDTLIAQEPALKTFFENYREFSRELHDQQMSFFVSEKSYLQEVIMKKSAELEILREVTISKSKFAVLGEMAGFMAHEIKNPLTILSTSTSVVIDMLKDDPSFSQASPFFESIKKTIVRIDNIVNSLKFYSRNTKSDQMDNHSIVEIIKSTLNLCDQKLYFSNCKVEVSYPESDFVFKCNAVSISQALLNIINNAMDAIQDVEEKWLRIECHLFRDWFEIRVVNSGPTLSNELREKIMLPYFTTKPAGKGTGIGLSIVRQIVELHNGSVYLDETSQNTSFNLKFPKTG